MSAVYSSATQLRRRVAAIDVCRGILFLLMLNTHALTLAGVAEESFWKSDGWIPNGWATQCFIVLSGFSIGVLFTYQEAPSKVRYRLWKRAKEVLIVMFFSNIFFLALAHVVGGTVSQLCEISWWVGLFTFDTAYSISAILIPTGLLLLAAPKLLEVAERWPKSYMLGTILMAFLIETLGQYLARFSSQHHVADLLFLSGIGGFPVVPFLSYGIVGIGLGLSWRRDRRVAYVWLSVLGAIQAGIYVAASTNLDIPLINLLNGLSGPAKFACIFLVTHVWFSGLRGIGSGVFQIVGMYALGSFILHRVFLQASALSLSGLGFALSSEAKYFLLVVLAFLCVWAVARLRLVFQPLDTFLGRLYF